MDSLTDPRLSRECRRLIASVREDLRRALGSEFSVEELADHYGSGTDSYESLALEHDLGEYGRDAVDAAFWEHLRMARDFAGGVRIDYDEL